MSWFFVGESIDRPGALASRAFAKWWLDLLRNIVIAGVLHALAARSGSWTMWIISSSAWLALYAYSISYILEWHVLPFPKKIAASKIWFATAVLISSTIAATILGAISIAITAAIKELAGLQG